MADHKQERPSLRRRLSAPFRRGKAARRNSSAAIDNSTKSLGGMVGLLERTLAEGADDTRKARRKT
ncbi:MAG: hypothetical protein OXQ92_11195 [Boseongicola sp.]|nr:hypothetical protein [Boseongicola sp.]MDD9977956.1 hypothetical protein [Boseongicola sp.]